MYKKGIESYTASVTILERELQLGNDFFGSGYVTKKYKAEALFGKAQLYNKSFSPNQSEQSRFAMQVLLGVDFVAFKRNFY